MLLSTIAESSNVLVVSVSTLNHLFCISRCLFVVIYLVIKLEIVNIIPSAVPLLILNFRMNQIPF